MSPRLNMKLNLKLGRCQAVNRTIPPDYTALQFQQRWRTVESPPLPGIKAEEKMAERLGFEPRDPLRSQWFSKPSRSAAPASLRWNSFDQWFTANCAKLPGSLSRTPEKTLEMVLPPGGKKINPERHWSSPDRHGLRLPGASA